jgi:drug/metabolite transporter (DMT)-like permease
MNAAMQTTIARCGSGVLVAEGERWIFGHQPGTGGNVLVFVLGLLGVVFSVNSITISMMGAIGVGVGFLLVGGLLIAAAVTVVRRRSATRREAAVAPLVVLDFASGMLLDTTGRSLAPLTDVAFASRMQLASSARALECRWSGGNMIVLRGDAFGGGIGPALDALRSRGLRA